VTYEDDKLAGCSLTPAPAATALSICCAKFVQRFIRLRMLFRVVSTCWAEFNRSVLRYLLVCSLVTWKCYELDFVVALPMFS